MTKQNPIDYMMDERGKENRVENLKITEYLHKKKKYEGRHKICHICEEIDLRWSVVRQGLRICSDCVGKTSAFYLKIEEYKKLKLID